MDNEKAIKILENYHNGYFGYKIEEVHQAHNLAIKALENSSWIPIKTEKISEAEKKELAERYDMRPEDFDDCFRYACKMPEDNQECLITTSVWGYVVIDTFHIDEDGAMYFEEHEYEDEVLAWMPLPKPYTKEDSDT